MGKELTQKQVNFVNSFLECGIATEAYKAAYSSENMTQASIGRKAYDVLHTPKVEAAILKVQDKEKRIVNIDRERILFELKNILDSKITDYLEFDGVNIHFKDLSQLTENQIRAIEGIKNNQHGIELKLHGKNWSIERICKMLGFDSPDKMLHEFKNSPFKADFTITYKNGNSIKQSTES